MITIKFSDNIGHLYGSFEEITILDNYNDIVSIYCDHHNLSSLPVLPNSLDDLYCNNNNLSSLPELPNSLKCLWCSSNSLSSLPTLPNPLKKLYCSNNNLSSLPELPNSITELCCHNNNLSNLPELPNSLNVMFYGSNPIFDYIFKFFSGSIKKYLEHQNKIKTKFVNKIGNWFIDCKYNPKYLYCRKRLMKEYDELYGS